MKKEFVYVMNGFLLTVLVLTAMLIGEYFANIPDRSKPSVTQHTARSGAEAPNLPSIERRTSKNTFGSQLFKNNCAFCHSITKTLTGPALSGVTKRIPDRKIIYKWVHNPAAVLKAGDPYFVDLQKQYGGVVMTAFPDLSEEEIDAILDYIGDR